MQANPEDLLTWYDRHARVLPWRTSPADIKAGKRPNPYHVWLSEIMLQQTTVATVKSYFEKFLTLWPRIEDLACASRDDVLKAWAGLGYYSRARNLKACADEVFFKNGGSFPEEAADLKALPGIGDYTSAAIAAIAFDKPVTVVDGNIERVISRLFQIDIPLPKAKKLIKEKASELTPQKRAGDYAQALMDLGATICTPKRPACALCPWRENCTAARVGDQELYPVKLPKKTKPTRYGWAFVAIREDGAILLRKRHENGLLGGMTEIPGTIWQPDQYPTNPFSSAPFQAGWRSDCGTIQHTFTHFHLEVRVVKSTFPLDQATPKDHWWSLPNDLPHEALPTVIKKMAEAAIPGSTKRKQAAS